MTRARGAAYSLSALERYQDCPFKFFAADVLRLDEAPEDEATLSPRARGRFIHEVFQRFFEAWDRERGGTDHVGPDRRGARRSFADVAEPLLARLPEADAALERARLFGSAISVGIVDVVLGLEASRPAEVAERLARVPARRRIRARRSTMAARVALKGVADRIDLLAGDRLRVIDYKSGYAPNAKRVAAGARVRAVRAGTTARAARRAPWTIDEAAYVAFARQAGAGAGREAGDADAGRRAGRARATRLDRVLDGIARGEFPPRPHDRRICRYCAYSVGLPQGLRR